MRFKTGTILLASALALGACKQDPLPRDGIIRKEIPPTREVQKPYGLKVPAVTVIDEGKESTLSVQAWVPAPYTGTVQVQGLPAGAVYDEKTKTISWTPSFDDGNRADHVGDVSREYTYTAILTIDGDESVSLRSEGVFVVRNVIRPMTVVASGAGSSVIINEGDELVQELTVSSADIPNGPFQLNAIGLPSGATISPKTGTADQFVVRYTPDPKVVQIGDGSPASGKVFSVRFMASAPDALPGVSSETAVSWTVRDIRLPAHVSAPATLAQGPEVNFTVSLDDPNGEMAPLLAVARDPGAGVVTITALTTSGVSTPGTNPQQVYNVRWASFYPDELGTRRELPLKACVQDLRSGFVCHEWSVQVDILANAVHLGASIDRGLWPLGEIPVLKEGVARRFSIPVRDLDIPLERPTIRIEPVAAQKDVRWDASSQSLLVTPSSAGVKQFNVIATSRLGLELFESFAYEALPADWSSTLVLTDSAQDSETSAFVDLIPGASLVNPAFQPLNARELAFRDTLVIGTRGLASPVIRSAFEKAASHIKNIAIASPLVGSLTGPLAEEFKSLGVSVRGRFQDAKNPSNVPLASFVLRPTGLSGLQAPSTAVRMQGTLTAESATPAIFAEPATPSCSTELILDQSVSKPSSMNVALKCERKEGGRLFVSGLEWGDWRFAADETTIAHDWVKEWVKP